MHNRTLMCVGVEKSHSDGVWLDGYVYTFCEEPQHGSHFIEMNTWVELIGEKADEFKVGEFYSINISRKQ